MVEVVFVVVVVVEVKIEEVVIMIMMPIMLTIATFARGISQFEHEPRSTHERHT